MGRSHPLTKLAATRPYSARKRVREALKACDGSSTRLGAMLGMSQRAAWDLIARLGLLEEAKQLRAARAAANLAEHQRRWSLHGRMYAKTPAGRASHRAKVKRHNAEKRARAAS